jgi:hypothetical protein
MWISRYRRGEWHTPSHDTGAIPYLRNNGIRHSCYKFVRMKFKWIFFGNGEWNKKMMKIIRPYKLLNHVFNLIKIQYK